MAACGILLLFNDEAQLVNGGSFMVDVHYHGLA